jgi:phosphoglycolate phosphatase
VTHILWDWNGTLLDDTQAALDTLNAMLARRGGRPISMDFYRDNFSFPVKPFYEAIGVRLGDEDWDALAVEYHDIYAAQPKRLNPESVAALEYARGRGCRQSIVSALRQDLLDAITAELGVSEYMDFIYGVDNLDGRSKADRARELVAAIGADPADVVMIGDSLHDKEVADALGVRCVLCAQGSHAAWRLRAVAPTGDTLMESVRMAVG